MFITREELTLHRIVLDKIYPADKFERPSEEVKMQAEVKLQGAAELVGPDIRIRGRIGTVLWAECDRCTAPMELPVEQDFDLSYRPLSEIAKEEEIEIPADELGVGFYSGDGINLADVVKEQVILALPMKMLCRPDCLGLCPVCGINLNFDACHCRQSKKESPFASLLETQGSSGSDRP